MVRAILRGGDVVIVKVKKDLSGMKFERLIVIEQGEDYIAPKGFKEARWLCLCDCQKKLPLNEQKLILVRGSQLGKGVKSCGCLQKERISSVAKVSSKKYSTYDLSGEYGIGYTTNGKEFYFDLEDYDLIKDYCWWINKAGYVYAYDVKSDERKFIFMHNLVMNNLSREFIVDHIKHSELGKNSCNDNRKQNLRRTNQSKNSMNRRIQSNNTSGVTGVRYRDDQGKWIARIKINGKEKHLGTFSCYEDAVKARKQAEEKYFGEYSYDNSMLIGGNIVR